MNEDVAQALDPLAGRAQVRIFTLADYAAEEQSGKLYVSGGGLEWTGLPIGPDLLLSFYLVIRLAYPIAIARSSHTIQVRALDRSGQSVGPDPLLQAEMRFEVSRAPSDAVEVSGTLPVQVTNYPVSVQQDAVIFLDLLVDSLLVSRLPLQLQPMDR